MSNHFHKKKFADRAAKTLIFPAFSRFDGAKQIHPKVFPATWHKACTGNPPYWENLIMKFTLEVGELEKHVIEFEFNQLFGNLSIRVDSQPVVQSTRIFNEPIREVFDFLVVGQHEKTAVRIEKQRKPLFGHHNRVFVNNRLTHVADAFKPF
jgi:hypothetical protein